MTFHPIIHKEPSVKNGLVQLSPIQVDEEYAKKWNENIKDFIVLTRDGELIRNTLYRIGGLGDPNMRSIKDNYIILLKYVEAFYEDNITKDKNRKPHLESRPCIIDKNGIEKAEFKHFTSPYLVRNSCIYSINRNYYNIETGYHYGYGHTSIQSTQYVFLDNSYDKDESKKGVVKINKKDGTWELFR